MVPIRGGWVAGDKCIATYVYSTTGKGNTLTQPGTKDANEGPQYVTTGHQNVPLVH